MSTHLTTDDEAFIQQAYLLRPEGKMNLSSLAVFGNDVVAHNAYDSSSIRRLAQLGYVIGVEDRIWEVSGQKIDVAIFQMTPLGLAEAERLVSARRSYTLWQRLAAINRSDWIALIALLVAIFALVRT